jgi:protoporphyrinogen oxidase
LQTESRYDGGDSAGIAVLGAGPAGLTAAYVLALRGVPGTVYEADGTVGGIAKTVEFNGYRFDLGGHRFFTKLAPVRRLWEDMLGDEFLLRPRLSRIYYQGKFISYPLRAEDVFQRLGLVESARCALSFLWSRRLFRMNPESFEDWVTMRFGKRLYEAFFRSYTEKVWGIPGNEIRAEWAAQRIKNFSLGHAVKAILGLGREHVTSLIEEFRYPRLGPGQMWDAFAARLRAADVPVRLNHRVVAVRHSGSRVESVIVETNGRELESPVEAVLSSIPLSELVQRLDPPAPSEVLEAAAKLRYRELCLVALITTQEAPFPDNWIYLHDPGTRGGRVQNFGAWSDAMVQPGMSCLGVEYFCFEGDEIWEMSDEQAVELAKGELARIGLIDPSKVVDGVKVRVPKAYPMYDADYKEAVDTLRLYLKGFDNLKTFGRNGLHRYNNQDHSMWTAILATLNQLDDAGYDVWSVNVEAEYHEEGDTVDALLDVALVQ